MDINRREERAGLFDGYKNKKSSPKRAFRKWLGYEDSNLGMLVSETRALPLGDTPTIFFEFIDNSIDSEFGGYDGIRTCDPIIMSDVL